MNKPKKNWIISCISLAVIVFAVGLTYFVIPKGSSNLAQQTAEPIEKALMKSGATMVCTDGDAGGGFGNDQPWRVSYFESSMDLASAKSSVLAAVNKNGFNLSKVPSETDGYLGDVVL